MRKALLVFVLSQIAAWVMAETVSMPSLAYIDRDGITVSGISSGAQMAHQLHIAFPEVFNGVGLLSGGPFGCAEGSLGVAMSRCMAKVNGDLPLAQFVEAIRLAEQANQVGETSLLADDPVWIFHGRLDETVAAELSEATVTLYQDFLPAENVLYVNDVEAAHNFPTLGQGSACSATESPYIGACDFDAAGELLQHLYEGLKTPTGTFQSELIKTTLPGAASAGLNGSAYLYIPPACTEAGQACKAHLVLHGCAQSSVQIGTEFIEESGFLRWAETNNIVLAFPQVQPTASNPFACWDWWGYTGAKYLSRDGAQMKLLTDWLQVLASD